MYVLFTTFINPACLKVLLHTFMDALREDEDREINHHGKPMEVGEKEENAVFHKTDSNERVTFICFKHHELIRNYLLDNSN